MRLLYGIKKVHDLSKGKERRASVEGEESARTFLHSRTENKQKKEGEESARTLNILALSHVLHGLSTSPSSIKKESIFYFLFYEN